MTEITFLLSIVTLLILLFVIAYIYGKQKAKNMIKYSVLIPIIFLCLLFIVIILSNFFNWFSDILSRLDWKHILITLGLAGGAFAASLDNSNKNNKKSK